MNGEELKSSLECYNKLSAELHQYISFETFCGFSVEEQLFLVSIFSKSQKDNLYSNLNSKIKTFIDKKLFEQMPTEIQEFLLKAKGKDLKDTQLLYLAKMPWGNYGVTDITISEAKKILDDTHSGMSQVKEKILKYIACQKRIGTSYGSTLLLVGPPGVGKTSIAKSISNAMGRNFVKISLAGTADADFLRGTSSIYSDSKPGMIIESIIEAENFAPLILLDEIDKMGASTQHGSPEHALLHILDNDRKVFVDDFLGLPIDLSQVIFVATANSTNDLSQILLDRLEVIKLGGYSNKEKLEILYNHILPRLYLEYRLEEFDVQFSKKTAEYIISTFSNEPGVRSLERIMRNIFETIVYYLSSKVQYSSSLSIGEVNQILGVPTSTSLKKHQKPLSRNDNKIKKRSDTLF